MANHLSKDGELGKSRLVPRFGSTTIIVEPCPNQAKLCMAGESIIIGMVDREAPIAQASREWEILDLECVIVSVAREESQARERTSGPGRREEEWEECPQLCEAEIRYDSEEYSLDQGQREAGLATLGVPRSQVWVDLFASGETQGPRGFLLL